MKILPDESLSGKLQYDFEDEYEVRKDKYK